MVIRARNIFYLTIGLFGLHEYVSLTYNLGAQTPDFRFQTSTFHQIDRLPDNHYGIMIVT